MGARLSSGMGKALKFGAVGAGLAAGGALGAAITKGVGRLTAIDDAEGKLAGLGHTAQSTAKIMDSALAAVKGTAFGLGDAATIAASAVAAGIKPGQELTKYLTLTADAATIAGVSLSDMGSIINKVQTNQVAYTDDLQQLADRGIPVFQWLQEEYGASAVELRKMVESGKVDADTFQRVIEENIGGAALAGGKTVRGAFANMGAAVGRFGAALAQPLFDRATGGFGSITEAIDGATAAVGPLADEFDAWLDSDAIPKLKELGATAGDLWNELRNSELVRGSLNRLGGVFSQLAETAGDLWPSVQQIAGSLAEAAAATGVSAWQVFLSTLEAVAPILDATLVPALDALASLMSENQGTVTALVVAFAAFKTIPAVLGPVSAATGRMSTSLASARVGLTDFTAAIRDSNRWAAQAAPQMSTFGRAATIAGGNAKAAFRGIKSSAAGAVDALGGKLAIGIAAAGAALVANASSAASAESAQKALADSVTAGAKAQDSFASAIAAANGMLDDQSLSAAGESVKSALTGITELGERGHTSMENLGHLIDNVTGNVFGLNDAWEEDYDRVTAATESNDALRSVMGQLKLDMDDLGRVVAEGGAEYDKMISSLDELGPAGKRVADVLRDQRAALESTQNALRSMPPEALELAGAIDTLSDSSSSAEEQTAALKDALNALLGIPAEASEAMADYEQELSNIASSAGAAIDKTGGFGQALIDANGGLDVTKQNARNLQDELGGLVDEFLNSARAGNDVGVMAERSQIAIDALATKYGLSADQVRVLAEQMGLVPETVETLVSVIGADESREAIVNAVVALQNFKGEGPATVETIVKDEAARQALKDLGLNVEILDATTGKVRITAENGLALAAMGAVSQRLGQLDASVATPDINANDTSFRVTNEQTLASLRGIDQTAVSPEIGAVINDFLHGRDVTLAELQNLDVSKASPEVQLLIAEALKNAQVINAEIDHAARDRYSKIFWSESYTSGTGTTGTPRASVGQHYGADGGLYGTRSAFPLASYANGKLPDEALIAAGRGTGLVQWAEGETGGEAFIPMALSKRARSMDILAEVADRFGMRLESYANGGFNRDAAISKAQSKAGRPYGYATLDDCSGHLSDVFNSGTGQSVRFTTASNFASMGWQPGYDSTGFSIGTNNGVGADGHMAGTLFGTNIESDGSNGVQYGGSADGALDFPEVWHWPSASAGDDPATESLAGSSPSVDLGGLGAGGGAGVVGSGGAGGSGGLGAVGSGAGGSAQPGGAGTAVFVTNWPTEFLAPMGGDAGIPPASPVEGFEAAPAVVEPAKPPEMSYTAGDFAKANADQFMSDLGLGGGNGALSGLIEHLTKAMQGDYSITINNPTFTNGQELLRDARRMQERKSMQHAGRPF